MGLLVDWKQWVCSIDQWGGPSARMIKVAPLPLSFIHSFLHSWAHHWSLSSTKWIHPHILFLKIYVHIILPSVPGIQGGLFPSGLLPKIVCVFLFSLLWRTVPLSDTSQVLSQTKPRTTDMIKWTKLWLDFRKVTLPWWLLSSILSRMEQTWIQDSYPACYPITFLIYSWKTVETKDSADGRGLLQMRSRR